MTEGINVANKANTKILLLILFNEITLLEKENESIYSLTW
jgi:hypothetical protein